LQDACWQPRPGTVRERPDEAERPLEPAPGGTAATVPVLGGIRRAGLLHNTVPLPLDQGVFATGSYRLRLDERPGLEITQAGRRTFDEDAE